MFGPSKQLCGDHSLAGVIGKRTKRLHASYLLLKLRYVLQYTGVVFLLARKKKNLFVFYDSVSVVCRPRRFHFQIRLSLAVPGVGLSPTLNYLRVVYTSAGCM